MKTGCLLVEVGLPGKAGLQHHLLCSPRHVSFKAYRLYPPRLSSNVQPINSEKLTQEVICRAAFSLSPRMSLSSSFLCFALASISCHSRPQICSLWGKRVTEKSCGNTADYQCQSSVTFSDETVMALQIFQQACLFLSSVILDKQQYQFLLLLFNALGERIL